MLKRVFTEIGSALLAIPAMALGLLLIAVFFQVAVESSTAWWEWLVSLGLALAATAVGLFLIGLAVILASRRIAEGWVGLFSGRLPPSFAPRREALVTAVSGTLVTAIVVPLGLLLFRKGVAAQQTNWAVMGLFFGAAGLVFGALPAIPGWFFGRAAAQRRPKEEASRKEHLEWLMLLAFLGIGLGLAVSFTFDERRQASARAAGRGKSATAGPNTSAELGLGEAWRIGCVSKSYVPGCAHPFLHIPVASPQGKTLRLEHIVRECSVSLRYKGWGWELGWPPRPLRDASGRLVPQGWYRQYIPMPNTETLLILGPRQGKLCRYRMRLQVSPGAAPPPKKGVTK